MNKNSRIAVTVFGLMLLICCFGLEATADCGGLLGLSKNGTLQRQSFTEGASSQARLLTVADDIDPISGLWKVQFIARNNPGIPDGVVLDKGISEWHSDKTEILNSGTRPPVTQSFCLGVWEKVGPRHYKLNHFAIAYDTNNTLVGPANIREDVLLSSNGQVYAGKLTIDQYDTTGNVLAHVEGNVIGNRINVNTPVTDAF
jgi:hypothetical protein